MAFEIITDTATEYLKKMPKYTHGYIMEGLSKGAYVMYQQIQKEAKKYNNDDWSQYHIGNIRGAVSRDMAASRNWQKKHRKAVITRFGKPYQRFSRTTPNQIADGGELAELTRWRVYEPGKAVIGWMNTRSFQPPKYRNGKLVGYYDTIKGTSLYDKKDTAKKHNIGELMEHGGKVMLTNKQKRMFAASGAGGIAKRGYVIRKARPIITPAYFASRQAAVDKMVKTISSIVDYDKETA